MFNKYKIGLDKTLRYAQNLYEKTYTTYPRTNSEYLTNEEQDKVADIIKTILNREQLNITMKDEDRKSTRLNSSHAT